MQKRLTALLLALLLPAAGCAQQTAPQQTADSEPPQTLVVRYDPSRYGGDWLNQAAAAFRDENPGVRLTLVADAKIAATAARELSAAPGSGSSVSTARSAAARSGAASGTEAVSAADAADSADAAFSAGNDDVLLMPATNWQAYARKGWLRDLSALSSVNVDGQSFSQRLKPGLRSFGRLDGKLYAVPLASGVSGLFYNAAMFRRYGWTVPKTAQELLALLPQIKAKSIAPFVWAGQEQSAWNGVVCSWWEQLAGSAGIARFCAMQNASVYADPTRLRALQLYEQLVRNDTNVAPEVKNLTTEGALQQLIAGRAAMMPGESWMLSVHRSLLTSGSDIRLMRAPAADGAALPDAYDATADAFACVPASARSPDLALRFLQTLAKDSVSDAFFSATDTPSAFNGMPADISLQAAAASSAAASAASATAPVVSGALRAASETAAQASSLAGAAGGSQPETAASQRGRNSQPSAGAAGASASPSAAPADSAGQTALSSAENAASSAAAVAPPAAAAASSAAAAASSAVAAASSAVETAATWADPFEQSVVELVQSSTPLCLSSQNPVYYNSFLNWPGSGEPYNAIFFGEQTAAEIFEQDARFAAQNWAAAGRVDQPVSAPTPSRAAGSSSSFSGTSAVNASPGSR